MFAFAALPRVPTNKSLSILAVPGVTKLPTLAVPVTLAVLRTVKYATFAVLLEPLPMISPPVTKLPTVALPVTVTFPPTEILPLVNPILPLVDE